MFWLGKSTNQKIKGETVKFSPIELIILAQLRSRELRNNNTPVGQYGYEMIKDLNNIFAGSWEAKSGTVYPILSKLENNKKLLISKRQKSPLGPVKKVYELTDLGRQSIDLAIKENFQSDLEFILNYFNMLSPFITLFPEDETREELLERLMMVPAKAAAIAMEHMVTRLDHELNREKLAKLKEKLNTIIDNIDNELK